MPVNQKLSREEKGKHVMTELFSSNCNENMIGKGQTDIDFIKRSFGVLPCFDDKFDKNSENYSHELTQSMVSAYYKMKAMFSSNGGSMNHEIPSTSQTPLGHIKVEPIGDCHHGCDIEAMSVSSSSKQIPTSWPNRKPSKTKSYRWTSRMFYRPKPVHLKRETLVVNHALYSQMAKGEEFRFFHRSGLAGVTVKVARSNASCHGSEKPGSDSSVCSTVVDEPIVVMEEITEVPDHVPDAVNEGSDNASCLSVEKQQSTNPLENQTCTDQVMDSFSFTTSGGTKERRKRSRCQPLHRKNNKTGKRKGVESRIACQSIGCTGLTMTNLLTGMVTPCKRTRQSITMEFVIDPTLLQAFKRRKWLLGSSSND